MKSFREFLQEGLTITRPYTGKNGLYVYLKPKNAEQIVNFFGNACSQPEDELHVTMVYSDKSVDCDANEIVNPLIKYHATPIGLEYWPGHDESGYLVLKIKSDTLSKRNAHWVGLGWEAKTFKEYEPHITLANPIEKDAAEAACRKFNGSAKLSELNIVLSGEACQDLKDD